MRKLALLYVEMLCCSLCMYAQEQPASEVIIDTMTVKSISYPSYDLPSKDSEKKKTGEKEEPYDGPAIIGVELRDTATVLSFKLSYLPESPKKGDYWYSINSDSFLVTIDDGAYNYFHFIGAEGITVIPEKKKLRRGESVEFKLYYEPLPEGTETFNLCEPGGWNFGNINLSVSNSCESQQVGAFNPKHYIVLPTFQGGDINQLSLWVSQRLVYPAACRETKLGETIYLKLTVGTDGKVTAEPLKGHTQEFVDEAMRVASMLPPMTPGSFYGRNCIVTYTFPVIFKLK